MKRLLVLMAILLSFATSRASAAPIAEPLLAMQAPSTPVHQNNGTFLTHAYVTTASFIKANLSTLATNMQMNYATNRLYVICGGTNASGQLINGAAAVPQVVTFLNTIATWEAANPGYHFQVYAYLSGSLITTDSNFMDVSNAAVRSNIATEAARFTSTSASGSYIAGANRSFDGVFIDLEPAGGTSAAAKTQFNNLVLLMDQVKSAIGPDKFTSFAAPKYSTTTSSTYAWTPDFYYNMASHVDVIIPMEYDTKLTTGSDYQAWIQDQSVSILQAVSGEYWTDGSHPAPTNDMTVMFGFPAFPEGLPNHVVAAENIQYAAQGVTAGLATLDAKALSYFGSAIVYLTTNGTGSDGYASYATDWSNFVAYW